MFAFFPENGTPFDSDMHTLSEDMDMPERPVVKHCVSPGIMRRTKSGEGEEELIFPATVELKEG